MASPKSYCFIYWDNSNLFIPAQDVAREKEGEYARCRVRLDFTNLMALAQSGRLVKKIRAAGSVPPSLRRLWGNLEAVGAKVKLYDRTSGGSEQQVPDYILQGSMMEDALEAAIDNVPQGTYTVVLCSGDGAGLMEGEGFFSKLKIMKRSGWNVEVLAWKGCCNRYMRHWVEENGSYVPLDDSYWSITYLEPDPNPRGVSPDYRPVQKLDLSQRPGYVPLPVSISPPVEDWDADN